MMLLRKKTWICLWAVLCLLASSVAGLEGLAFAETAETMDQTAADAVVAEAAEEAAAAEADAVPPDVADFAHEPPEETVSDASQPENAEPAPATAVVAEPAETAEEKGIAGFFKKTVTLFDHDIAMWMLIAAGAALVLLVLLIVLLITGKKKKKKHENMPLGQVQLTSQQAFITSVDDEQNAQMVTDLNDEPTMDLSSYPSDAFTGEEATVDLQPEIVTLKVRMIFNGQYLDQAIPLKTGDQAVIGRGTDAVIQTNPEDKSISHRHGVFTVSEAGLSYTDESRNGTTVQSQHLLHQGETATIPFGKRVQLDIGAHQVLVFATKDR